MDSSYTDLDDSRGTGIPERVRQAGLRYGIQRHRLVTFLHERLGYDRHRVHRRMKDNPPWQRDELEEVAKVFGITVEQLLGVPPSPTDSASPSLGKAAAKPSAKPTASTPRPLSQVGDSLPERAELTFLDNTLATVEFAPPGSDDYGFVAVRVGPTLRVYKRHDAPAGMPALPVARFLAEAMRPQVVALVEDSQNDAEVLAEALKAEGIDSRTFSSIADFTAAHSKGVRFDAYIFDWYLGRTATPEAMLPVVRGQQPIAPILLTSGKVDKAGERHLSDVCDLYKLELVEKPFRAAVLAQHLRRLIYDVVATART